MADASRPDEHPVLRWLAVLALVVGVGGGTWKVLELSRDISEVKSMLAEIKDDQAEAINTSDTRFTTRGNEHRDMARTINRIDGVLSVIATQER